MVVAGGALGVVVVVAGSVLIAARCADLVIPTDRRSDGSSKAPVMAIVTAATIPRMSRL